MRGTRPHSCAIVDHSGIIPAYAGNTSNIRLRVPPHRDHPRVCGEHLTTGYRLGKIRGSSPRMRGTPAQNQYPKHVPGIIPAYAGNTDGREKANGQTGDHPRVCGEHGRVSLTVAIGRGSSPRMRGTPVAYERVTALGGIIPAYAGNTMYDKALDVDCKDHPRVCGEHTKRL